MEYCGDLTFFEHILCNSFKLFLITGNMEVTDNNVFLEFDLEGFEEEDIKVKVKDDSISVKASSEVKDEATSKGFVFSEEINKSFSYFSNLPKVDSRNVKTNFDNGKLRVSIPRIKDGK